MNANKTVPVYEIKTLIKIDEITNIGKHVNIDLRFKSIQKCLYKSSKAEVEERVGLLGELKAQERDLIAAKTAVS